MLLECLWHAEPTVACLLLSSICSFCGWLWSSASLTDYHLQLNCKTVNIYLEITEYKSHTYFSLPLKKKCNWLISEPQKKRKAQGSYIFYSSNNSKILCLSHGENYSHFQWVASDDKWFVLKYCSTGCQCLDIQCESVRISGSAYQLSDFLLAVQFFPFSASAENHSFPSPSKVEKNLCQWQLYSPQMQMFCNL